VFNEFTRGKYSGVMTISHLGHELYFTNKSADFINSKFNLEVDKIKNEFDVDSLMVLNQVHLTDIVKLNEELIVKSLTSCSGEGCFCADGFIFKSNLVKNKSSSFAKLLVGIRTADCLPIFIQTNNQTILLHAGWRGVASGIISNALSMLGDEEVTSFIIGPAAGAECYEVGTEVISQFAPNIVQACPKDSKYMLDLKATALKVFEQDKVKKSSDCLVEVSKICTICDSNWHSHRREGTLRGSNLMFVRISF
jgi:copper oxidase (laccase) domain-containing protein